MKISFYQAECGDAARIHLIHGIGIISSRLLDEVKQLIASKKALPKLNIFISHETNDAVLTVEYARSAKLT